MRILCTLLVALGLAGALGAAPATELAVEVSAVQLSTGEPEIRLVVPGSPDGGPVPVSVSVGDRAPQRHQLVPGEHTLTWAGALPSGSHQVVVAAGGQEASTSLRVIPGWLSLLPPLLAIGLALVFKDVLVSLFLGVFSGALILASGNPFTAFARTIDQFARDAVADADHAAILMFSLLLGGMVGVIGKSGGTLGIVERLSGFATTARRGQVATWLMGLGIFFDDYANTLIVGPTMRPITDRLKIAREKLAYIVDSTAAPVASLVPISTWVGYEIGLIGEAMTQAGLDLNPYATFVETIPYRFYPLFALWLVLLVGLMGRDFGPMLRAERRASATGKVVGDGDVPLADPNAAGLMPPEGVEARARNAVLPIVTVVAVTLLGLALTGAEAAAASGLSGLGYVREMFAASDSYAALLWASLAGAAMAVVLGLFTPGLRLKHSMEGLIEGLKSMMLAIVVLVLAWSLGAVTEELDTAGYVVHLLAGVLSPFLLPVLVFLASAAIAFATGTSWATMAILIPIGVPVIVRLATAAGVTPGSDEFHTLLLGVISSVLAGSVWGDHCSPISDTTILSSMASGCDHIAHVRTQLPYAFGVGVLGMALGDIPTAYGLSPWISLAVGAVVIAVGLRWLGKPTELPGT